jgi:hypothetical protein
MELVSKVYLGSCPQLYSVRYSLAETRQLSPHPYFGLIYDGAIGQPRYTTSLCNPLIETALHVIHSELPQFLSLHYL